MQHTVVVASLLFSLVAPAAESAEESPPAPVPPATADEFVARLQAPVALENIRADAADGHLEISFSLREVGDVFVAVYAEDEDSGRGLVTVGDAVVTEIGFVDGAVAWEASDFSALSPAQAHAVVASLLQVWHEEAVMNALLEDRDLKCTLVGKIAGATIGVAVFSGCGLVMKSPKCIGYGYGALHSVSGYISDKCNGAQNG